ncbi:uncharacterized protein LOC110364048 isoform X1 [Columba livia]|uniref:uncharacterized protein LOC110364048 isoform X1 n=1 Tax=Columba livia TaxID=8932 RepID=UPI0031B9B693
MRCPPRQQTPGPPPAGCSPWTDPMSASRSAAPALLPGCCLLPKTRLCPCKGITAPLVQGPAPLPRYRVCSTSRTLVSPGDRLAVALRVMRWLHSLEDPGVLPPTRWHRARESDFQRREAASQLYGATGLVWEGSYSAFGSQGKIRRLQPTFQNTLSLAQIKVYGPHSRPQESPSWRDGAAVLALSIPRAGTLSPAQRLRSPHSFLSSVWPLATSRPEPWTHHTPRMRSHASFSFILTAFCGTWEPAQACHASPEPVLSPGHAIQHRSGTGRAHGVPLPCPSAQTRILPATGPIRIPSPEAAGASAAPAPRIHGTGQGGETGMAPGLRHPKNQSPAPTHSPGTGRAPQREPPFNRLDVLRVTTEQFSRVEGTGGAGRRGM